MHNGSALPELTMSVNAYGIGSEPLLLTVKEAANLLRISRNLAYQLVAQRRLPSICLGRRILIPRLGLERWIAQEASLPEPLSLVVASAPQRH